MNGKKAKIIPQTLTTFLYPNLRVREVEASIAKIEGRREHSKMAELVVGLTLKFVFLR